MAANLYANTAAASGPVALGGYVFVEEPGRLQILHSAGEYAAWLIISTLLALGGMVGFSLALLWALGAAKGGWMLAMGALTLLGLWGLSQFLKGRILWTYDRNSGQVLYRGKLLRSLSSIKSLTILARSHRNDTIYYVEFTRKQSSLTKLVGPVPALRRKEILVFGKPQEALQAATILATFLGVRVLGGEASGLKVILTGNGRDVEHLDFRSGKPGDGFIFRPSEASGVEQTSICPVCHRENRAIPCDCCGKLWLCLQCNREGLSRTCDACADMLKKND
jgi:hypothetical protein